MHPGKGISWENFFFPFDMEKRVTTTTVFMTVLRILDTTKIQRENVQYISNTYVRYIRALQKIGEDYVGTKDLSSVMTLRSTSKYISKYIS